MKNYCIQVKAIPTADFTDGVLHVLKNYCIQVKAIPTASSEHSEHLALALAANVLARDNKTLIIKNKIRARLGAQSLCFWPFWALVNKGRDGSWEGGDNGGTGCGRWGAKNPPLL